MIQRLRHRDILQTGAQVHLTRAMLASTRPKALHGHDFYELFWVQNGTVRHHLPDRIDTLREGDVVFLRPGDTHGLQGRGEHALVVSLCLHPTLVKGLGKRHPTLAGHLFWAQTGPTCVHRDIRQMAAQNHAAVVLERSACDTLAAEAFLLPLCAELIAGSFPNGTPEWLARACRAAKDPAIFQQGAAGLVAQAGKAHAHVSRSMRMYLGVTPSDYINTIRMRYAARMLITDADPVNQIAADCGIPNMSHFHKLFRTAHRMTPLQYRQQFQRTVVQP